MIQPAETDVIIVGAGPVALFAVFELGLFDMRCHLIDALSRPGGQCGALYPDKPIYDIPGLPSVLAQGLVDRLLEQIAPFRPTFSFNQTATTLERAEGGRSHVTTDKGLVVSGKVIVIASGGGSLRSRRSRGPMTRLDPIASWGLRLNEGLVAVDTKKFETSTRGIFAIGDVNAYPGKLKLILSGFHEAALMTQAARDIVNPGRAAPIQYTSSSTSLRRKLGLA